MMILIIVILVAISMDIIPIFYEWSSRIYIGRYKDSNIWKNDLRKISINWLSKTPKIKVTDNTRWTIIDRIRGEYSKDEIQYWQKAALVLAIAESKEDSKVNTVIKNFLKENYTKDGSWIKTPENIDSAILSYALMNINGLDVNKYKNSLDITLNIIKDNIGEEGTVLYRKGMKEYRYVDTIGFICPFLIKYGITFNSEYCIELAIKQIKEYKKYGMEANGIPYHAYNIKDKSKLGLCGWGRGIGWYSIGIIDSLKELPKDNKHYKYLEECVKELATEIIKLQNENGGWSWTSIRKESRIDSSTTAILAYFLVNASKLDEIKKEAVMAFNKAIKYLMSVTRRNGSIDFSQGDTKDIGVYSMSFSILPFTQGFALRSMNYMVD